MRFSRKKAPSGLLPPAPTIRRGIGEFSPTAPFQLEKNLQHAPHLVAAGMPLLLGLTLIITAKDQKRLLLFLEHNALKI